MGFKRTPLLAGMRRPKSPLAEVVEVAAFFDNAGAAGEGNSLGGAQAELRHC
jgi:hypothetical protein